MNFTDEGYKNMTFFHEEMEGDGCGTMKWKTTIKRKRADKIE